MENTFYKLKKINFINQLDAAINYRFIACGLNRGFLNYKQ